MSECDEKAAYAAGYRDAISESINFTIDSLKDPKVAEPLIVALSEAGADYGRPSSIGSELQARHPAPGVEYDATRAKSNAIDWLKMMAIIFRTEGDIGNARMAEAVAAQIACDFEPPALE